jgi:hypothetical protein
MAANGHWNVSYTVVKGGDGIQTGGDADGAYFLIIYRNLPVGTGTVNGVCTTTFKVQGTVTALDNGNIEVDFKQINWDGVVYETTNQGTAWTAGFYLWDDPYGANIQIVNKTFNVLQSWSQSIPNSYAAANTVIVPPNSTVTISSNVARLYGDGVVSDEDVYFHVSYTNLNPPDYRPMAVRNGSWQSCNRSGGWLAVRKSGSWSEARTVGGPSATGDAPSIYRGSWYNQRQI